jgi:hypothetical protein
MTQLRVGVIALLGLALFPHEALACRCVSFTPVEQSIAEAPIVVVGRVVTIGSLRLRKPAGNVTPVVEVELSKVVRGAVDKTRVDIWTSSAGSSCPGSFGGLEADSIVVMAVTPSRARDLAPPSVLKRTGVTDLYERALVLYRGTCGVSIRTAKTEAEADGWLRRVLGPGLRRRS